MHMVFKLKTADVYNFQEKSNGHLFVDDRWWESFNNKKLFSN